MGSPPAPHSHVPASKKPCPCELPHGARGAESEAAVRAVLQDATGITVLTALLFFFIFFLVFLHVMLL